MKTVADSGITQAVLDGEVVVLANDGTSDFQALQKLVNRRLQRNRRFRHNRRLRRNRRRDDDPLFYVFDVPYLEGFDLTHVRQIERKELLARLMQRFPQDAAVRYSDHILGHGASVFKSACQRGLEGIISKHVDGFYEQKRSSNWVQVKCMSPHKANHRRETRTEQVAGVRISHPDRVLFPEQGLTKLDLAEYYAAVADWMLPHLVDRPLTLVRCPSGRTDKCFYQKHLPSGFPETVTGIKVKHKGDEHLYVSIDDEAGLVTLVQMGVLEIHPWSCRKDDFNRPDRLIFDLDPGDGVAWASVVDAARELRQLLLDVGLESFVRTSGGKGLHIVVPLVRRAQWTEVKAFSKQVAEVMVRRSTSKYVSISTKAKRKGKIYVDYLRNDREATAIASYSTRARRGAPVATPIRWDELARLKSADQYNTRTVQMRLSALNDDPWSGFYHVQQSIASSERKTVESLGS
jgi:bifunctional non-homologous end joining protein LigD